MREVYVRIVKGRLRDVAVRGGAIALQVIGNRNALNDGDEINRFIVRAMVTHRRILISHVYRFRVIRYFAVSKRPIVGWTVACRFLPLIYRCKAIWRFHLFNRYVVRSALQVSVVVVAGSVQESRGCNGLVFYIVPWYVKDRRGLQVGRLRVVIRRKLFNDQAMFAPVKDRRVFLIRRHPPLRVVSRIVGAIMIRAVHRRHHIPICRLCVFARLHGLDRSVVMGVVAMGRRHVSLLRACVARDLG